MTSAARFGRQDAWTTTRGQRNEYRRRDGYYNREGRGRPNGPLAYPHGAVAFHDLLRRWRAENIIEVLQVRASASV